MKIDTLEAGRGVAALSVVLFHMNASASFKHLPTCPWLVVLLHGVDFFFVISGFIIFYVHRRDIGHPGEAKRFFFKRFIRLYPTLWIIAPAWIVASILFHKAIGLPQIMTTILLTPSMLEPVPDVVWTLRHEVLFYASFLVLILNRRLGILLYGVWTSLVVVQLALAAGGHAIEGLPSFFLSTYELDFLMGAGIALLAPAIRPAVWPLAVGLVLVTGALVLGDRNDLYRTALVDYVSISATWWVLALGVCFAALLYGMLAVESLVRVPRWLVFLGGSSYALYLVHVPIQIVLASAAGRAPAWLVLTAMVVVPVAAGAVLHVAIERPLSRWLRKALLPPPAENARAG